MEQLILHNLKENKTLGNVLKENGVQINKFKNYWEIANNTLIGNGIYGKVFDIGNDKVLKITSDEQEYEINNLLIDEINNGNDWFKYFVNLPLVICPINENFYEKFDDDSYNDDKKYIRYYFIFEKLIKLSDYEINIFNKIFDFYDTNFIEDFPEYDEDEENNLIEYLIDNFNNFDEDYILEFLRNISEFVMEFNVTDIHIENIMKDKNGNLKIIDLRL